MPKRKSSHYTLRIADRICEKIALGGTIKVALASEPLGPTMTQLWRWMEQHPEFAAKFERAQQMSAVIYADELQEMSEEVLRYPNRAPAYRVASDLIKWQAEIRDPKKYGQKVQHELKAPPLKPEDLRTEIKRLENELGVGKTDGISSSTLILVPKSAADGSD